MAHSLFISHDSRKQPNYKDVPAIASPPVMRDSKWQSRDQPNLTLLRVLTATLRPIRMNLHCKRALRKDVCQTLHRQSPGRCPFWPTCTAQTTAAVYLNTEKMYTCRQMTPYTTIIHCKQQLHYTALPTHYTEKNTQQMKPYTTRTRSRKFL